jgi:hypothetical protein
MGTLTLTRVGAGHIAGGFDVKMASLLPSGQFDTVNTTRLTGMFDATSCSGAP